MRADCLSLSPVRVRRLVGVATASIHTNTHTHCTRPMILADIPNDIMPVVDEYEW